MPSIINASTSTGLVTTADTSGVLQLQTGGTTAVTVDASQNVGIGTASPNSAGVNRALTISGTSNSILELNGGATRAGYLFASTATGATILSSVPASGILQFNTVDTERMRIDSSGNVGIGTSSPTQKLQVAGNIFMSAGDTFRFKNSASNTSFIRAEENASTAAYTYVAMDGRSTGYCAFSTNDAERMRIDSSGNLLVGLTSQTSTEAVFAVSSTKNNGNAARIGLMSLGGISGGTNYPQIGYNTAFTSTTTINYLSTDTASWIRFNSGKVETFTAASGTAGNAISATTGPYVAQGGTSWTNSSDERLKDIIEPITDATNKVGQLRAVIGKFKTDPEDKRRSFLIAQDVQAVLPEAVDVSDPESLGVQYTDVIPLLVAAIKEQQAIIQTLTDRITALEGTTP